MSEYKIKETKQNNGFCKYEIQQKFLFFWFTLNVDERYLCSLHAAQRWINLKKKGYPADKYYYD